MSVGGSGEKKRIEYGESECSGVVGEGEKDRTEESFIVKSNEIILCAELCGIIDE